MGFQNESKQQKQKRRHVFIQSLGSCAHERSWVVQWELSEQRENSGGEMEKGEIFVG